MNQAVYANTDQVPEAPKEIPDLVDRAVNEAGELIDIVEMLEDRLRPVLSDYESEPQGSELPAKEATVDLKTELGGRIGAVVQQILRSRRLVVSILDRLEL